MTKPNKLVQRKPAWFEMVGTVLREAAERAKPSPDHHVSLLERYVDAADLGNGLVQGIRLDIAGGEASFRVGGAAGRARGHHGHGDARRCA